MWVGGQKHLRSTHFQQFSSSAARFSPWGSVMWQKGSFWKHFFILRIAVCHCCCRSDTYLPATTCSSLGRWRVNGEGRSFFLSTLKSPCFWLFCSASTWTWLMHPFLCWLGNPCKWDFKFRTNGARLTVHVAVSPQTLGCWSREESQEGAISTKPLWVVLWCQPAQGRSIVFNNNHGTNKAPTYLLFYFRAAKPCHPRLTCSWHTEKQKTLSCILLVT